MPVCPQFRPHQYAIGHESRFAAYLSDLSANRAFRGGRDELGKFRKGSLFVLRFRLLPFAETLADLGIAQIHGEFAPDCVEGDLIAFLQCSDRSANEGLRGDVASHQAVCSARESAVGHQRNLVAEPFAVESARNGQHFAHTGAALRALVTNDYDITSLDLAAEDGLHGSFLAVKHASGAH